MPCATRDRSHSTRGLTSRSSEEYRRPITEGENRCTFTRSTSGKGPYCRSGILSSRVGVEFFIIYCSDCNNQFAKYFVPKRSCGRFRSVAPFWVHTGQILSSLPPKRECSTKRVKHGDGGGEPERVDCGSVWPAIKALTLLRRHGYYYTGDGERNFCFVFYSRTGPAAVVVLGLRGRNIHPVSL